MNENNSLSSAVEKLIIYSKYDNPISANRRCDILKTIYLIEEENL